jgi:long-subunit acyl-CoA synthetase (AMP-forming)
LRFPCSTKNFCSGTISALWIFHALKFAMSGAAPMSDALKQQLEAVLRVQVLEGYGMTEASPGISLNYPGA